MPLCDSQTARPCQRSLLCRISASAAAILLAARGVGLPLPVGDATFGVIRRVARNKLVFLARLSGAP